MSTLHASQCALGYYHSNREFNTHAHHRRMLWVRQAQIAGTVAAHREMDKGNASGAASTAGGNIRAPESSLPTSTFYGTVTSTAAGQLQYKMA